MGLHRVLGVVGVVARALGRVDAFVVVVEQLTVGTRAAGHTLILRAVLLALLSVPARSAHGSADGEFLSSFARVTRAVWETERHV